MAIVNRYYFRAVSSVVSSSVYPLRPLRLCGELLQKRSHGEHRGDTEIVKRGRYLFSPAESRAFTPALCCYVNYLQRLIKTVEPLRSLKLDAFQRLLSLRREHA